MCMKQHHLDRNRKAVQRGLDRRREEAHEAALDASGQALLEDLRKRREEREAAVCRHVDQVVEETNREIEQRKAQLHQEQYRRDRKALAEEQFRTCLRMTFGSLLLAVSMCKFFETGLLPIWIFLPATVLSCIVSVWNFVAYATRNRKAGECHG